jgi:hypothetical protein
MGTAFALHRRMTPTTEHQVTIGDLRNLMTGEGGVDLERVIEDGQQVAMRVVGVRPGTTAERLGAHNGDTIETINDAKPDSVSAAYKIAEAAMQQAKIVIKGRRAGAAYVTVLCLTK